MNTRRMNIGKKFRMIAILALMICCMMPAAYVNGASGYGFRSQGVTVKPGGKAAKFIDANRKYLSKTTNAKSCIAKSGYDVTRVYTYFTIVTYASKKNGKGKLESITITNPQVVTPEGLSCGMDESEVKKCYDKAKSNEGVYIASKGKTKLYIETANGKVKSIEYLYSGKY